MNALLHVEHVRQAGIMQAFAQGLRKHGISGSVQRFADGWKELPSFIVVWGMRPHIPEPLQKLPRLYLEAGYINGSSGDYVTDRLRFISCSWDKLHGESRGPSMLDRHRWKELGVNVFPWRRPKSNRALVMAQHPSDAVAFDACYPRVHRDLLRAGWRVHIRQHPLVRTPARSLAEDIAQSDICVTYCSTAAVESVLMGVPTVTLSRRAIAWPVCSHAIGDDLYLSDRISWLQDLACRQWTLQEFRSGDAWDILST